MARSAASYRHEAEARAKYPDPGTTPFEHLRHTLAVWTADESPDETWAIRATGNIYGDGLTTGLTYGDLRSILDELAQARAAEAGA